MRLADSQNIATAQLIARLNQEKTKIVDELDDQTRRLTRLGETGANESSVPSVVAAIQGRVAQLRKLKEEIKLLLSSSFSMATPRVDETGRTRRSRASSVASSTSEQGAMSEDEDEQL